MATLKYTVEALVPHSTDLPLPERTEIGARTRWTVLYATRWGATASKQQLDQLGEIADRARVYYRQVRVMHHEYRNPSASKLISR